MPEWAVYSVLGFGVLTWLMSALAVGMAFAARNSVDPELVSAGHNARLEAKIAEVRAMADAVAADAECAALERQRASTKLAAARRSEQAAASRAAQEEKSQQPQEETAGGIPQHIADLLLS